ncbi:hypothetical protein JW998_14290 [candidate division KSB1 bacterium]|nr:hypothetical protein [candidate division KSB1 bacterium]
MKKKLGSIMLRAVALIPLLSSAAMSTPCPYLSVTSNGWTGQLKRCYTFTWGVSSGIIATVVYHKCEYVGISGHSGTITVERDIVDYC